MWTPDLIRTTLPVYYINLDAREDRRQRMEQRITHFGLQRASRWSATNKTDPVLRNYRYIFGEGGGVQGCAVSHLHLWQHLKRENVECALVLEDDATFHPNWLSILAEGLNAIQRIDPKWHGIFLDTQYPCGEPRHWVQMLVPQYHTGGYLLSSRGLDHLLTTYVGPDKVLGASDDMTKNLQSRGHSYTYFPWLVMQEREDSDVQSAPKAMQDRQLRDDLLQRFGIDAKLYV